jgi:hypothetical protein
MKNQIGFILILSIFSVCFSQSNLLPQFEEYLTDSIYHGKISDPNFTTNKDAIKFKSTIKNNLKNAKDKNGINFAGHFIICEWGCGSPCQKNVIVDAKTGYIYNGINTCWSYKSRPNSKLLIANPDSGNIYNNVCKTEYYLWDNDSLRLIQNK